MTTTTTHALTHRVYQYTTSALDHHHYPSENFPNGDGFNERVEAGQWVVQRMAANGQWRNHLGPFNEKTEAESFLPAEPPSDYVVKALEVLQSKSAVIDDEFYQRRPLVTPKGSPWQSTHNLMEEAASVIAAAGYRDDLVEKLRQRSPSVVNTFWSVTAIASDGTADGKVAAKWFVWAESDAAACAYIMEKEHVDNRGRYHYLSEPLTETLFEHRAYKMETGRRHWS